MVGSVSVVGCKWGDLWSVWSTDKLLFCVLQWALMRLRAAIVLIHSALQMLYLSLRTWHASFEVTASLGTAIHGRHVFQWVQSPHRYLCHSLQTFILHMYTIWIRTEVALLSTRPDWNLHTPAMHWPRELPKHSYMFETAFFTKRQKNVRLTHGIEKKTIIRL